MLPAFSLRLPYSTQIIERGGRRDRTQESRGCAVSTCRQDNRRTLFSPREIGDRFDVHYPIGEGPLSSPRHCGWDSSSLKSSAPPPLPDPQHHTDCPVYHPGNLPAILSHLPSPPSSFPISTPSQIDHSHPGSPPRHLSTASTACVAAGGKLSSTSKLRPPEAKLPLRKCPCLFPTPLSPASSTRCHSLPHNVWSLARGSS